MSTTKSIINKDFYLLGNVQSQIICNKIPTNRDVISVYIYLHNVLKFSFYKSAELVAREVFIFWEKVSRK